MSTPTIKPPFAYYGGKTMLARRIVSLLPPHESYLEPFAGSLAVLLAKPRARHETVNDLDADLVHFWRVLRDHPEELVRACALTPHSRVEHLQSYNLDGCDDIERARRIWVRLSQGRSGRLSRTGWRWIGKPAGSTASLPRYLAGYVERMNEVAERLAGVTLEQRHALELIEAHGRHPDTLIYADPPYVGSTRATGYRRELREEHHHVALAEALRGCKAAVVLSGYHSPLYDELYADWHVHEMTTTTGQGGARAERTEVLWSNRELE